MRNLKKYTALSLLFTTSLAPASIVRAEEIGEPTATYAEISPMLWDTLGPQLAQPDFVMNWNPGGWTQRYMPNGGVFDGGRTVGITVSGGFPRGIRFVNQRFGTEPTFPFPMSTSNRQPINVMTRRIPVAIGNGVTFPPPTKEELAAFFIIPEGFEVVGFAWQTARRQNGLLVALNDNVPLVNNMIHVIFGPIPVPPPEELRSITLSNGAVGVANDNQEIVFTMTSSEFRAIEDNTGFFRGIGDDPAIRTTITGIDATSDSLTFNLIRNTSGAQRIWEGITEGSLAGFYHGSLVYIDSDRPYTIVVNLIPDESLRSIHISNGFTFIDGEVNEETREIIFEGTHAQFGLFQDSAGWIRGNLAIIDADHQRLTFDVGSRWTLGLGDQVGFLDGHKVSIAGINEYYTIRISVLN